MRNGGRQDDAIEALFEAGRIRVGKIQRAAFAVLRELARDSALDMETLSMGTSDDFEAAIAEGSTIVRLGTALFGPRT